MLRIDEAVNLRIAEELGVREPQIAAAISLLDGGATVPFVARYRKEATGALDDAQLRTLEERLRYLRELDERRAAILDSISQQGKLDAALIIGIDGSPSVLRVMVTSPRAPSGWAGVVSPKPWFLAN